MTPVEVTARLRDIAFETRLDAMVAASDEPFGFITEFRHGDVALTLAVFITGDVSLYYSTGGGVIGGVGRPELAEMAKQTISELKDLLPAFTRTDFAAPPEPNEFCAYVLTPSGRYALRSNAAEKVTRESPITKVVHLSGALLAKVREAR